MRQLLTLGTLVFLLTTSVAQAQYTQEDCDTQIEDATIALGFASDDKSLSSSEGAQATIDYNASLAQWNGLDENDYSSAQLVTMGTALQNMSDAIDAAAASHTAGNAHWSAAETADSNGAAAYAAEAWNDCFDYFVTVYDEAGDAETDYEAALSELAGFEGYLIDFQNEYENPENI